LVAAAIVAVFVWRGFGWDRAGIAVISGLLVFVVGAPGALNSLRQLGVKGSQPAAGEGGGGSVEAAEADGGRFRWTSPQARALLRALASELPLQDDIIACARASSTDLSRARISGTPDNAWQSLIEIAYESGSSEQLAHLLDAAAGRSALVKTALDAYRLGGRS
jgi:hypothetical protein